MSGKRNPSDLSHDFPLIEAINSVTSALRGFRSRCRQCVAAIADLVGELAAARSHRGSTVFGCERSTKLAKRLQSV
jgi:hypothetical protein